METLSYTLPKKAQQIIAELATEELYQVNFFAYLSFCCSNYGYFHAADHFMNESKSERYHFTRLSEFLQSRGIEPEVPKVKEPELKFTDLKSGIKAAFELEISMTEKYDEAIKMMRDIDTMAYLKLCDFMAGQQYALESYTKMWAVFGDLKEEDQKEQDILYFAPKAESAMPS